MISLVLEADQELYVFANHQGDIVTANNLAVGTFLSGAFGQVALVLGSPSVAAPGSGYENLVGWYEQGVLDYLPGEPNFANPAVLSMHFGFAQVGDRLEQEVERFRRAHFPLVPSRLSAVYAFGDRASCERAHQLHGWPLDEVYPARLWKFPPEAAAANQLIRVHRANMNLITLARGGALPVDAAARDAWWSAYWSGSADLPGLAPPPGYEQPLWEWLIEGRVGLDNSWQAFP